MLTHWFKETPDFTHLMAQHVGIQHFGLTSWKKRWVFFQFVSSCSMSLMLWEALENFCWIFSSLIFPDNSNIPNYIKEASDRQEVLQGMFP